MICKTDRHPKLTIETNKGYQHNNQIRREKINSEYGFSKNEYGLGKPSIPQVQKVFKGQNIINQFNSFNPIMSSHHFSA